MAAPIPAGAVIDQSRDFELSVIWVGVDASTYTAEFAMREDYDQPVLFTIDLDSTPSNITITNDVPVTLPDGTQTTGAQFLIHLAPEYTSYPEGEYVAELVAYTPMQYSLIKGVLPLKAKVVV